MLFTGSLDKIDGALGGLYLVISNGDPVDDVVVRGPVYQIPDVPTGDYIIYAFEDNLLLLIIMVALTLANLRLPFKGIATLPMMIQLPFWSKPCSYS